MIRFLWHMRPYFRQVAGELLLGSICGILMNTAVVLPAVLLGRAIDKALAFDRGEGSSSAAALAALMFVFGTLATEVPRIGKRWWLMTANARIRSNIRADAFRGVLAWPIERLNRTPIGDSMARIVGDVEVLGVGVREFTIETWDTVLFLVSIVVTMAFYDFGLTVLALLPVPCAMVLAHASGRWISRRTTLARSVNADLTASIQENLAGARVLRLFGRRASAVDRVAVLAKRQADANLGLTRLRAGLQPAYSTLMTAGIVLVVWQGGDRVISGAMTIGAFVAYLQLFVKFVGRGYRVPQLVNSVQSGAAAYERLEPLLAPALSPSGEKQFSSFRPGHLMGMGANPSRTATRPGAMAVTLDSATFSYPGAVEPAFRDLSLTIPAGSFVAITGPIGAGKSALARCLAGISRPSAGSVRIGDQPAFEVASDSVGYAPQDGYLFSGTVRENVILDEEAASRSQDLANLLELAGLSEDIAAFPTGMDTQIGELGIRVSGGQRQRLALARAAGAHSSGSPGVLVLDDPFSAVDVETEAQIVRNLHLAFGPEAPAGRRATILLFSHRLAAFPQADLVVVLRQGRIEEMGTHLDLVERQGLYSRIYRAQLRAEQSAAVEAMS